MLTDHPNVVIFVCHSKSGCGCVWELTEQALALALKQPEYCNGCGHATMAHWGGRRA